ncbi:unnamed protein product, partial [Protopolystoma xenopodis]
MSVLVEEISDSESDAQAKSGPPLRANELLDFITHTLKNIALVIFAHRVANLTRPSNKEAFRFSDTADQIFNWLAQDPADLACLLSSIQNTAVESLSSSTSLSPSPSSPQIGQKSGNASWYSGLVDRLGEGATAPSSLLKARLELVRNRIATASQKLENVQTSIEAPPTEIVMTCYQLTRMLKALNTEAIKLDEALCQFLPVPTVPQVSSYMGQPTSIISEFNEQEDPLENEKRFYDTHYTLLETQVRATLQSSDFSEPCLNTESFSALARLLSNLESHIAHKIKSKSLFMQALEQMKDSSDPEIGNKLFTPLQAVHSMLTDIGMASFIWTAQTNPLDINVDLRHRFSEAIKSARYESLIKLVKPEAPVLRHDLLWAFVDSMVDLLAQHGYALQ